MARFFLKIAIFAALWVLGSFLFGPVGGEGGLVGNALFVGERVLGSTLSSDADAVVGLLLSFIVTAAVYYVAAEVVTLVLSRAFMRK